MASKKAVQVSPQRGDHVRLRGREPHGILKTINDEFKWAVVDWDTSAPKGPRYVHLQELQVEIKV